MAETIQRVQYYYTEVSDKPGEGARLLNLLKEEGVNLLAFTGFLIQGDDRVGAIADIMTKLAEAKINVTAVDAAAAGLGRYGAILWVKSRDVKKAANILGAL
ncbi:MAG: hypothetical protein HYT78_10960 [Deltaproteobacteria bacterium]|nr:hypothetical protein [Deltaproteobacteria bacterium]